MFVRYILLFLFFFLSLNASPSSECINIEKRYFTKEQKNIKCYVTEFTEDDDKFHCIEKSYNRFNRSIDSLFRTLYREVDRENKREEEEEDNDGFASESNQKEIKPFTLNINNGKEFCANLSERVNAIFSGAYGLKKKEELKKASKEIKENYKNRLLNNVFGIKRDVPKICVSALKSFLDKKLKGSRFLHIPRNTYYDCLDRNPPKKGAIVAKTPKSESMTAKDNKVVNKTPITASKSNTINKNLGTKVNDSNNHGLQKKDNVKSTIDNQGIEEEQSEIDDREKIILQESYDYQEPSSYQYSTEAEKKIKKLCKNMQRYYNHPVGIEVFEKNLLAIFKIFHNPIIIQEPVPRVCIDLINELNSFSQNNMQVSDHYFYKQETKKIFAKEKNKYISSHRNSIKRNNRVRYDIHIFSLDKVNHKKADKVPNGCRVGNTRSYFIGICECISERKKNELSNSYPSALIKATYEDGKCKKH